MHLSLSFLTHLLDTWGYLAVFAFVAIESAGIPIPGETMLVTAAVYAGTGHLSIALVIAAAAAGAIIGDNLGYLAGRYGGRSVVTRYGKYVRLRPKHLQRAEVFFDKYGDRTVFIGRFVAVLRAFAAFLAGVNRMPWPKFLVFNGAGGITWAVIYGMLGFLLGHNLPLLHRVESAISIGGIVIAALAAIGGYIYWRVRLRRREDDLVQHEPAA